MDLLFAHYDGGQMLAGSPDRTDAATEAKKTEVKDPTHLRNRMANADNLSEQGWGVVIPKGEEGEHLKSLVQPLIDKRQADLKAGTGAWKRRPIRIFEADPNMNAKQAEDWLGKTITGKERDKPLYLLLLGDMDRVSFSTQQVLADNSYLTGRLGFPAGDDASYQAYVKKVLDWEHSFTDHAHPRSVFYTVKDDTVATTHGYQQLVEPCVAMCEKAKYEDFQDYPAAEIVNERSERRHKRKLKKLTDNTHPTVLFSLSHGMGPPRAGWESPKDAHKLQGAMHLGLDGALLPEDVANTPFLPGGLWFYFACFGCGTPDHSKFHHWLKMLDAEGMEGLGSLQAVLDGLADNGGFTSGITRAALANPQGPLGIIGHIDLAWSYSYEELRVDQDSEVSSTSRADDFYEILHNLVKRKRMGAAFTHVIQTLDEVSKSINRRYDDAKQHGENVEGASAADRLQLGNLWMLNQDLRGYVMLGDPAVRLPEKETPAARRKRLREQAKADKRAKATVEDKETALLKMALDPDDDDKATDAAQLLGVDADTARQWLDAYREAGRAVLQDKIEQHKEDSDE